MLSSSCAANIFHRVVLSLKFSGIVHCVVRRGARAWRAGSAVQGEPHSTTSLMMAVPMMLAGQPKSQAPPATWFFLVSGGEKRAEDEASTRKELKKIYTTILEQRLAESDHIVYLSGGQGMLSIDPMLRHSYEGSAATLLSAFLACSDELTAGWQRGHTKPNGLDVKDSG